MPRKSAVVQMRVDLSRRASPDECPEWMDEPSSYEDFRDCLRDLAQLNRLTRAHGPTLEFVRGIAAVTPGPLHVVDVGCGGGDLLREIEAWSRKEGRADVLTGIDLNPYAAQAAREFTPAGSRIRWVTGDAFSTEQGVPVDCVVSSLFTHHLPDAEIVRFLRWMEETTVRGWFINDLYRAPFPFYGVQVLAWVARWHRFVRHDAPVSFRRSFRLEDWRGYLAAAGIPEEVVEIPGVGPARLCLGRVK